jgi:hypothetical protein
MRRLTFVPADCFRQSLNSEVRQVSTIGASKSCIKNILVSMPLVRSSTLQTIRSLIRRRASRADGIQNFFSLIIRSP